MSSNMATHLCVHAFGKSGELSSLWDFVFYHVVILTVLMYWQCSIMGEWVFDFHSNPDS
jgi:hypothetical protein